MYIFDVYICSDGLFYIRNHSGFLVMQHIPLRELGTAVLHIIEDAVYAPVARPRFVFHFLGRPHAR